MSAVQEQERSRKRRASQRLGPLPRPLAFTVLGVWAVLTMFALAQVIVLIMDADAGAGPWSGATQTLLPASDRSPHGRSLALMRVDLGVLEQAPTDTEATDPVMDPVTDPVTDPVKILAEAGFAVEDAGRGQRARGPAAWSAPPCLSLLVLSSLGAAAYCHRVRGRWRPS